MARLSFTKMHGIGNDYVYVDCFSQVVSDPAALARRVSPRHTGIGSDGLILIQPSSAADCRMEMYNADGSRGGMCGNGIRCVAKYVYDHGIAKRPELRVETDAGIKTIRVEASEGRVHSATVDMGAPILDGPRIPVAAEGRIIDQPFEVGDETFNITCVSMGNPHCVVFVDGIADLRLESLGPQFETHRFFPERVNTEFVEVSGPAELKMRVWERGSGETRACGTGACAVVVAAALTGRAARRSLVHLAGGDLHIDWLEGDDRVLMTGPAEEVFAGEIDL
jgi:diaminopimelate epimerase